MTTVAAQEKIRYFSLKKSRIPRNHDPDRLQDSQSSHESVGVKEKLRRGLFDILNDKILLVFSGKTNVVASEVEIRGPRKVLISSDGDGIDSNEVVRETAVRRS